MVIFGIDITVFISICILLSIEYAFAIGGLYYFLYYKQHKLNLIRNPLIIKKDFELIEQYNYVKKIDKVPQYTNVITCIILRENKTSKILYFSHGTTDFRFDKSLYFIVNPHTCDNGSKLVVYLEGISLPLSYENVQKETMIRKYIDLEGNEQSKIITVIKGLKWDGKILNVFVNQKFADIFTHSDDSILPIATFIIGICTLIIASIGIGVTYFFR